MANINMFDLDFLKSLIGHNIRITVPLNERIIIKQGIVRSADEFYILFSDSTSIASSIGGMDAKIEILDDEITIARQNKRNFYVAH